MRKLLAVVYGVAAYATGLLTLLYFIGFSGNVFVPKTVDVGAGAPAGEAWIIDVLLVALFGLQHSVMARPAFKARWTRVVPPAMERSVYVLSASIALMILFLGWRPIDTIIWNISNPVATGLIWFLFWAGWAMVLISTFLINHFELFGLQQAWLNLRGKEAAKPELRQPLFYRWVAHPLYSGFFLAFWATPEMTAGHLLLATGMSVYMLIGIRHEERDMGDMFGDEYRRYRAGVGGLFPRFGRRKESGSAA